jgi:pyruvate/2-oxoglutarate/acetoin dehydrogenase E1 component
MGAVLSYFDQLCEAMVWLAHDPKSIFVGQGVGCAGTTMTDTLKGVPEDRLLEFPVAEDLQMGATIGMALDGWKPVCIFPRWNFLICATNQIVNHLDRLPLLGYHPKVIIRVAVPAVSEKFDPGPQHDDDFTEAFRSMLRTVKVVTLRTAEGVLPAYREAFHASHSTILVEYTALYNAIPSGVKCA